MRLSSIEVISTATLWILTSVFDISSSEQGAVCPGDQLNLTCLAAPNETLLQWSIDIPSHPAPELRFISTDGITVSVTPFTVGQTVFQFLRISTSPLTSLMVIDNVRTDVNGTRVECSSGGRVVSTDIINVIGNEPTATTIPTIASQDFRNDSVIVTLELMTVAQNSIVMISVQPQARAENISNLDPRRILLTLSLSYNTIYSVSTTATLCGRNSSNIIELYYANCASPMRLLNEDNERLVIADYSHPAIEGTNVSFSCPPGLVLTGPSVSTCMGNGEWEPDPSQVKCNVAFDTLHPVKQLSRDATVDCGAPLSTSDDTIRAVYNSTLEGSQLELSCRDTITAAVCSTSGIWIPDPNRHTCRSITSDSDSSGNSPPMMDGDVFTVAVISSIIVFILSSILFFFVGCVSGWFCHKYKTSRLDKGSHSQAAPVYQDLQPSTSIPGDREKVTFELKENIAYGPIQSNQQF